jgi:hypothetical protein
MSDDSLALLQRKQVAPLPIGPGGKNATKQQMNDTNTQLTMLSAQATANTMFDPPPPPPVSKQVVSGFCSGPDTTVPELLVMVGIVMIVYGALAK